MAEPIESELRSFDINRLTTAIHEQIDYFRKEYRMTYAEAIGGLYIVLNDLDHELREE